MADDVRGVPPAGDVEAALVGGVSLRAARAQPRRVRERQPGEADVLDGPGRRAADVDERLAHRELRPRARHVLPGARPVVDPPGAAVEVPLAGAVEQLVRVLQPGEDRERPERREAVRVRPARLAHDELVAARGRDPAAHDLPLQDRDGLELGGAAPPGRTAKAVGGADEARGVRLAAGAHRAAPVHVQLPRARTPRHRGPPDAAPPVVQVPAGERAPAAEDRTAAGRRAIDDLPARSAAVARVEDQGRAQPVGAVREEDPCAVAWPRRADDVARAGERSQRRGARARGAVVAARRHPELQRRRGRGRGPRRQEGDGGRREVQNTGAHGRLTLFSPARSAA